MSRYDLTQSQKDHEEAIKKSFELVERQIAFFHDSKLRKQAMEHLDLAYLHTINLIRNKKEDEISFKAI